MSYYTKITKAGLAAITTAMNNNSKVPITYMAFGDGNGSIPEPDENATALVNEVYRVGLNKVEVHSKNQNWLVCEAIIPSAVGGFNIREVALYDNTGNSMLAVASYPPTYKPTVEEGAAKIQTIRIVLQVDNTGNFELVIDPDVVLATVESVENVKNEILEYIKNRILSLRDFGYVGDGELHQLSEKFATLTEAKLVYPSATSLADSIDTVAVQKAIDYCKAQGKTTKISVPSGTSIHNKEIIWKSYAYFEGVNFHDTVFKKAVGFDGRLIVSENFDQITGTSASLTELPIINFAIDKIKLDGQYIVNDQYVNNFGRGNLFIYGTKYKLNVKSVNTDGVGVWLEYAGGEDFVNDVIRDADVNLIVFDTAEEGFIFKGAPDIVLGKIIQKSAGKITSADSRNYTLWSSKNYPDLGRIDGIVFNQGAEIGIVHAFGNSVGYGIRCENGRINAELLVSESNLGGIDILSAVYGLIDKVQIHNIKGGVTYTQVPHASAGTFANIYLKSTSGLKINSIRSDHSGSGQTGQNHLHILGSFNHIGSLNIKGYHKPGHAIVLGEAATQNIIDTYSINDIYGDSGFDGLKSACIVRLSNNSLRFNSVIKGTVINASVGFRASGVNPQLEVIGLNGKGIGLAFDGIKKSNLGQDWNISIYETNGNFKTTYFKGTATANSTLSELQELSIPHNLIHEPSIKDMLISIIDTPTGLGNLNGKIEFCYVSDISISEIKIHFKMKTPTLVDTTPYVNLNARL